MVPLSERQEFIWRYHDSLFAGHLVVSRTVYRLLERVYWPGLRQEVRSYLASCPVCLARKSPCPRRAPMGHVSMGHRWDGVAMDILDMSVTTPKGNRYVLVIVDCFSRWIEACLSPKKTALAVADAFFRLNHASNYRIAVLQDGVKLAARVGRSRKAAQLFMDDEDIPCGHQVAVMFQIVCALALEMPAVLLEIRRLSGVSPNVDLACEPWGHRDHCNDCCECLSSDRTGGLCL